MVILNRNIKHEEWFSDHEIFKLFTKKNYAELTPREKVALAIRTVFRRAFTLRDQ